MEKNNNESKETKKEVMVMNNDVEIVETKKTKMKKVGKKVLKVLGLASIGFIGGLLGGSMMNKKNDYEIEETNYEVDSDNNTDNM